LSLNLIQQDEVEFAPGVTFSKAYPRIRKITLPCHHSFGAMNLIYHFARNHTRCPLCRYGHDARLDTRSIPVHFRRVFIDRIRDFDRIQRREAEAQDQAIARNLFRDLIHDIQNSISHIYMTVFGVIDEQAVELFQCNMVLLVHTITPHNSFHFGLSRVHRRALVSNLADLGITNVQISFSVRDSAISIPREISRSDAFPVHFDATRDRIIRCNVGLLSVTSQEAFEAEEAIPSNQFKSLVWSVPVNALVHYVALED
jgi:hypothetical protein